MKFTCAFKRNGFSAETRFPPRYRTKFICHLLRVLLLASEKRGCVALSPRVAVTGLTLMCSPPFA